MLYFSCKDQEFKCAPAALSGRDRVGTGPWDVNPVPLPLSY